MYDAFAAKLAARVAALKVDAATNEEAEQGPLINERALEKVEEHIRDAVEHGAKVLTGGKRHALGRTFFRWMETTTFYISRFHPFLEDGFLDWDVG